MRLLIVRLSALGDIVHTLPVAANAGAAGHETAWVVEPAFAPLLEGNPHVSRVIRADTKRWRGAPFASGTRVAVRALFASLRDFEADAVLDVQGLWKSAVLARAAGGPVTGFAASARREGGSALLCHRRVVPPPEARHVVEQNLALLSALGIPAPRPAPDARYLLARPDAAADLFLGTVRRPFALYHPGAGRPEKAWSAERFAELARRLAEERGLEPVVSWGPGDEPRVERFLRLLPAAAAAPPLSLPGLARVTAAAALFVGGDTGPLHLADAVGTPVVALFGPTDPARNGPFGQPGSVVRFGEGDVAAARAAAEGTASERNSASRRAFEESPSGKLST